MYDPERPICATCPHFNRGAGATASDDALCTRFPPVRVLPRGPADPVRDYAYWDWPVVEGTDGCGEHPAFPAFVAARKERRKETTRE